MTISVIKVIEPWRRVSAEVFRQDAIEGKTYLGQEGKIKTNLNLMYMKILYFWSDKLF